MKSSDLFERSKAVSPGGVHSPVRAFKSVGGKPIFFKSAKGAYLTSVEGDRYIDLCQSFGPLMLGHRDPEIQEVVLEMIDKVWTVGAPEPYSLELAEFMTENVNCLEKVRFVSSGTEAVMSAIRVARAATNRPLILKFEGCYHGHTDGLLVKAGSGLAGTAASDSAGVSPAVAAETLIAPLGDIETVKKIFETHGKDIALVVVEPLPANFGLLPQKQEFLEQLAQLTKSHGSLLLFDEVISGFRVAMGGMAEVTGIKPDLVCYGKVIGGGLPVGAYGGRKDLMDMVAPSGPVYQAGTLSANPIGMVAGLATLKKIKRDAVIEKLQGRASVFKNEIESFCKEKGLATKVTQRSSLFWLHQADCDEPHGIHLLPKDHAENFGKLFHKLLEHGVFVAPSAFEVGFFSLAHTESILDELVSKFKIALLESST